MNLPRIKEALRRGGGVLRSADLYRAGLSPHHIHLAIKRGDLERPRRGWVALPNAASDLIEAARHGVVISCITQAHRLGLWVLDFTEPHYATRLPNSHTSVPRSTLHWGRPLIARHPGLLTDSIENVLAYVAGCQPYESALAIWESALQKGLVQKSYLHRLPFKGVARKLLAESTPYSDSGLETMVGTRLRRLGLTIIAQAHLLGRRVDFLIDDWLVLQIDGGHHVGPQRTQDIAQDAQLLAHGYVVVRVGYEQVVYRWNETQQRILEVLATRP